MTAPSSSADTPIACPKCGAPLLADAFAGACPRCMFGVMFEPATPLGAPPEIAGYRHIRRLGHGGMGVVWLAEQLGTKREVAVKFLKKSPLDEDGKAIGHQRFLREVQLAASLRHTHIARVYDGGQVNGAPYYVMEYVDGCTLLEYARRRALAASAVAELLALVCEAVCIAHRQGIVHRDLKPGNILVTADGQPMVLDFGLARNFREGNDDGDSDNLSLSGAVLGTPRYMAPEQARGERADVRSDVYALGVILHELFVGTLPHEAAGPREALLQRRGSEDVRRPSEATPGLDRDLESILLRALEREPAKRYADAGEMAADLRRYLIHQPLAPSPKPPAPATERATRIARAGSAAWARVLGLGLGALLMSGLLKQAWVQTKSGSGLERWVYAQLQLALSTPVEVAGRDVQIVDTSGIERLPVDYPLPPGHQVPLLATPREKLLELLGAITAVQPRAVAVDLDFSAWGDGRPVTSRDGDFFDQVRALSEQRGVPIYLGLSRQRWQDAAGWLGEERWQKLAVAMEVPIEPETRYYVRWLRGAGGRAPLPGLALALAGRAAEAGQNEDAGSIWRWALRAAHPRSGMGSPEAGVMSWALVDYSALRFLENEALGVVSVETLRDNPQKLRGRMVLLGDASAPQGPDRFGLGELYPRPMPGVYLHACAALTAREVPLRELTTVGRVVMALVAGLLMLLVIELPRLTAARAIHEASPAGGWLADLRTVLALLGSWLLAFALMRYGRIVWTDFTAVTLAGGLYLFFRARFRGSGAQQR